MQEGFSLHLPRQHVGLTARAVTEVGGNSSQPVTGSARANTSCLKACRIASGPPELFLAREVKGITRADHRQRLSKLVDVSGPVNHRGLYHG